MDGWVGIGVMVALGVGFGAVSIALGSVLGPRNPTPEKMAPYECGMPPVGDARERQSVKFYLIAMIFLLFDIEIAFLGPWALSMRDLSWPGLVQIIVFFLILTVGYVYIWRKGVLDWGPEHDPEYPEHRPAPGPAKVKRYTQETPVWESKPILKSRS